MKHLRLIAIISTLLLALISISYASSYQVTTDLTIRAVINTVEKGPIEAVWQKGGEDITSRGDRVIWGHFYASPSDVAWGSQKNPDLFVKIWFDVSGRIDVNFFHVSVPKIEVYSDYPYDGKWDQHGTTTMDYRYIRHEYWSGGNNLILDDLVGTYNLSGFTVTYSDGTTITQNDVSTFSGTMVIESDGDMTQTIKLNGYQDTIYASVISVGNNTVKIFSAGCTYDLGIALSGNVLTTNLPLGTCGSDYSEVDVWTKTRSNITTSMNNNFNTVIDDDSDQTITGGSIGYLYQLLQ